MAYSTAVWFRTGSTPGIPAITSQTLVLGSPERRGAGAEQQIWCRGEHALQADDGFIAADMRRLENERLFYSGIKHFCFQFQTLETPGIQT